MTKWYDIEMAIESVSSEFAIVGGDLNIEFYHDNARRDYMEDMCEMQQIWLAKSSY